MRALDVCDNSVATVPLAYAQLHVNVREASDTLFDVWHGNLQSWQLQKHISKTQQIVDSKAAQDVSLVAVLRWSALCPGLL